jgi:hypothetical protein
MERMLDTFPLLEEELNRLLNLYDYYCQESGESDTGPSLSQLCIAQNNRASNDDPDFDCWHSAMEYVEEVIFPEASRVFHGMGKFVSVVGCPESEPSKKTFLQWQFLEGVVSLVGRRGSRILTNFIYDTVIASSPSGTADANSLVDFVYRVLLSALFLRGETKAKASLLEVPKSWVVSLSGSSHSKKVNGTAASIISRPTWVKWTTYTAPEIIRGISTFYHAAIFSPAHPFRQNALQPLALPQLDQENLFWSSAVDPVSLSIACPPSGLGGKWYRLYCSDQDGLSFLSFQKGLQSYAGATVMLIRTKNMAVFGFYTDCPWKDSRSWFGGEGFDSYLFRLDPVLSVYGFTYEGKGQYMYLNLPLGSAPTNNNVIRGLCIGGISPETPRVHLTTTLENCKATSIDITFSSGPLLQTDEESFFDVDAIEVWAVNASEIEWAQKLSSEKSLLARKEEARHRAAQVDRSQFVSDFQSGAFINKLFSHRHEARGRHDFVAADDARKGYYIEDKRPSMRNAMTEDCDLPTKEDNSTDFS